MEQLHASVHPGTLAGNSVIRLKGPLTLATYSILEQALTAVGEANTIIDVYEVPYIDSAGLGTIIAHFSNSRHSGRGFAMTGVNRRIQLLLELTHVDSILPVFPTPEAAEQAFAHPL
jgi:anti-sigma B factor antagonist